jgi:hypothetical protein
LNYLRLPNRGSTAISGGSAASRAIAMLDGPDEVTLVLKKRAAGRFDRRRQ